MMRILVVHDIPLFREGLRSFLRQQEECLLVGEATQREEVLILAGTEHPEIVLLDGELASADPLGLTWQLRELGVPGILIFASLTADEETFFQFFRHGATAYVDGTISGEALMVKLRKMCLGEYLMDSEILSDQAVRRTCRARFRRAAQEALQREKLGSALESVELPPVRWGTPGSEPAESVSAQQVFQPMEVETQKLKEASPLTESERRVLEQVARGQANAQIARQFGVSQETIKSQLYRLMKKLHTKNRTAAVIIAASRYWMTIEAHEETNRALPGSSTCYG